MGAAYYEITKTMHNLPLSIYLHKKSPFQKVEAHWHRALEISIVFDGKVDFYNGRFHEVVEKIVRKYIFLFHILTIVRIK